MQLPKSSKQMFKCMRIYSFRLPIITNTEPAVSAELILQICKTNIINRCIVFENTMCNLNDVIWRAENHSYVSQNSNKLFTLYTP